MTWRVFHGIPYTKLKLALVNCERSLYVTLALGQERAFQSIIYKIDKVVGTCILVYYGMGIVLQ